jgi:PAS domain S-box-containing protein
VEETLREERSTFATIMEISPVGIVTVDAQGTITYANTVAERVLGLTRDEITSRRYDAPLWNSTTLSGTPLLDEDQPFSIVKRTNAPVHDIRHGIRWPDGRRVFLSVNGTPMRDEKGEFVGMVASVEDITERILP